MPRNYAHVIDVPLADYVLRLTQAVVTIAQLFLTAYTIVFGTYPAVALALFSSVWGLGALSYYLISIHALPFIYNWIAILAVESFTVIFWGSSLAANAALFASNNDAIYNTAEIAIIAISGLLFILHITTLTMDSLSVKRHRKNGEPLFSPQGKKAISTPSTPREVSQV